METCPHCIPLIPIWKTLQERIHRRNQNEKLGLDIIFIDEEAENIDSKLEKYNQQYFNGEKKIQVQMGYPTIFFGIPEKKVDYYEGNRSLDALESWYMDKMGLQKKIENSSVSPSPSSSTIESSSPSTSFLIEKLLSNQHNVPSVPRHPSKKGTRKTSRRRRRSSRSRKNRRSSNKTRKTSRSI